MAFNSTRQTRQPGPAPLPEGANSERLGSALHGPPHQRWRRVVLQPPVVPRVQPARDTCAHFGWRLAMRLMEYDRASWFTASSQRSIEQKYMYITRLARKRLFSKKVMERTISCRLFKCYKISSYIAILAQGTARVSSVIMRCRRGLAGEFWALLRCRDLWRD